MSPLFLSAERHVPSLFKRHISRDMPATLLRYRVVKRVIDLALIIASIPLLLPLLATVALLVTLTSPGPIFFSHRRLRRESRFFSMWKFRTMCENSEEILKQHLAQYPEAQIEWKAIHKLRKDPRLTPVGSFLRRYSLDELPQIWNVITGEMTLVGPRPIVTDEIERYGDRFSYYCGVVPGMTGLWQISGRNDVSYDIRVSLDCEYVARWSLCKDVVILFRTFSSVIHQNGAF